MMLAKEGWQSNTKKEAQLFPCGKQLRKLNVDKILSKVIGNY